MVKHIQIALAKPVIYPKHELFGLCPTKVISMLSCPATNMSLARIYNWQEAQFRVNILPSRLFTTT
jgi:hypothetical protein